MSNDPTVFFYIFEWSNSNSSTPSTDERPRKILALNLWFPLNIYFCLDILKGMKNGNCTYDTVLKLKISSSISVKKKAETWNQDGKDIKLFR